MRASFAHDFGHLTGDNVFIASWQLRNGRIVAVLHRDPDPAAYVLKGDGYGGWTPGDITEPEALAWAESRIHAAYPHAQRSAR